LSEIISSKILIGYEYDIISKYMYFDDAKIG